MDWLQDFATWAWDRHHNPLSWYIRPMFIIPFCYFAYRRSLGGVLLTIFGLLTSMFWFPKPDAPDAQVVEFLRMEKEYLLGPWPWWKILISATIPAWFFWLALALWTRSFISGAAAITAAMAGKLAWSFYFGNESAWTLVPPSVIGLLICYGALYALYRYSLRTS